MTGRGVTRTPLLLYFYTSSAAPPRIFGTVLTHAITGFSIASGRCALSRMHGQTRPGPRPDGMGNKPACNFFLSSLLQSADGRFRLYQQASPFPRRNPLASGAFSTLRAFAAFKHLPPPPTGDSGYISTLPTFPAFSFPASQAVSTHAFLSFSAEISPGDFGQFFLRCFCCWALVALRWRREGVDTLFG